MEHGVDRILTHGGSLDQPIEKGLEQIKSNLKYAANRIIIMPGGGITSQNAEGIQNELGVHELHGSKLI